MADKRRLEVMQRREVLLARISGQREQIAVLSAKWQAPLKFAGQSVSVLRFLRSHPLAVAGAAGLLLMKRRGLIGFVQGSLRIWKAYRNLRDFSKKLMPGL